MGDIMKEKKNIPEIRFKGIEGKWGEVQLKDISFKITEKNSEVKYTETFTNSAVYGIISQRDYFDNDISNSENIDRYFVVKSDDFVYNPRISSFAPVGPINRNRLGRTGIMSPLYTVLRTQNVDKTYLEQFFKTDRWHAFMRLNGDTGARSDRFSIKDFLFFEMPIPFPEVEEQSQIGSYFQNLDKQITLEQQKHDKLVTLKKAMLEKMFPKEGASVPEIRFEGFENPWIQKEIKELFKITRGEVLAATETSQVKTGFMTYPVYSSQTKNNGLMGYYHDYLFENAITWTTDGANAGTVKYRKGKFYSTNVNGVLLSDDGYANQAIAESINIIAWKHVSYVGNPKLMNNVMSKIKIYISDSLEEQQLISDYFNTFDTFISLQQQKIDKLKNIKKACLDKMFV